MNDPVAFPRAPGTWSDLKAFDANSAADFYRDAMRAIDLHVEDRTRVFNMLAICGAIMTTECEEMPPMALAGVAALLCLEKEMSPEDWPLLKGVMERYSFYKYVEHVIASRLSQDNSLDDPKTVDMIKNMTVWEEHILCAYLYAQCVRYDEPKRAEMGIRTLCVFATKHLKYFSTLRTLILQRINSMPDNEVFA